VVVVVRTELEQMGQRREHEQQDLEQNFLGGARSDQQRQQEQHLDLDQFDDQHQSHPAGHEFLFEQLLCGKHMILLLSVIDLSSVIIRRIRDAITTIMREAHLKCAVRKTRNT